MFELSGGGWCIFFENALSPLGEQRVKVLQVLH